MIFIPDMDVKLAVDPYFIWAEATDFRDYGKVKADDWVSFVVECKDGETVRLFATRLKQSVDENNSTWCKIPNFYLTNSVRFEKIKFCTIQVQRKNILTLQKEVKRFELGMPVNPRSADNVLEISINDQHKPVDNLLVVGIIDDFVGFAHNTFTNNPGALKPITRVERVWSQSLKMPAANYWKKSKSSNSYGFELDFSKIKSAKNLRLAYPVSLPNMTHGSHVASVAAGKKSYKNPNTAADLYQDAAASASIIAVHLPQSTLEDSSGGAMNAQLLDGIHYILVNTKDDATLIINASYSTHAGAHDGTSILEEAMDELILLSKGRLAIVLPVGNHYEARGHAKFDLTTNSEHKKLVQKMQWQVLPDCSSSSFMEIWLPAEHASLLKIELTDPQGKPIEDARVDINWVLGQNKKSPQFAIIFPRMSGSSKKNVMALVVVSPTRQDASNLDVAQHGLWTVTVGLTEEATRMKDLIVPVDAWIERNDTIKRAHRQRGQSYFVDVAYEKYAQKPGQATDNPASYIQREGSRNTIAGGKETIVIGGYQSQNMLAAAYSACSPDVTAMSDENKTLRGVRGAGARGLSVIRMNGTSVAAPVVARCIANYLFSNSSESKADLIAGLPSVSKAASSARKQRVLIPERDGEKQVGV